MLRRGELGALTERAGGSSEGADRCDRQDTGEVDCVYHVAFDELVNATESQEDPDQRRILDVLIAQERLMRFEELVGTLLM